MEIAYQTNQGLKRENNQDYVGIFKNQKEVIFAIVADGMGGHRGGDVASEMAVSSIGDSFETTDYDNIDDLVKWLVLQLQQVNSELLRTSNEDVRLSGMGTTMVAVILVKNYFIVANIGDSRAYLLRQRELTQLTEDHSLVNELIKSGQLSKDEAKNYLKKNIITRTLGVSDDVDADVTIYPVEQDDNLLLCTDGLTNMVDDEAISKTLNSEQSLDEKSKSLIEQANSAGGVDNITAVLIHLDGKGVNEDE